MFFYYSFSKYDKQMLFKINIKKLFYNRQSDTLNLKWKIGH